MQDWTLWRWRSQSTASQRPANASTTVATWASCNPRLEFRVSHFCFASHHPCVHALVPTLYLVHIFIPGISYRSSSTLHGLLWALASQVQVCKGRDDRYEELVGEKGAVVVGVRTKRAAVGKGGDDEHGQLHPKTLANRVMSVAKAHSVHRTATHPASTGSNQQQDAVQVRQGLAQVHILSAVAEHIESGDHDQSQRQAAHAHAINPVQGGI